MIVKMARTEPCFACKKPITLREYEGIGGLWTDHHCKEMDTVPNPYITERKPESSSRGRDHGR